MINQFFKAIIYLQRISVTGIQIIPESIVKSIESVNWEHLIPCRKYPCPTVIFNEIISTISSLQMIWTYGNILIVIKKRIFISDLLINLSK